MSSRHGRTASRYDAVRLGIVSPSCSRTVFRGQPRVRFANPHRHRSRIDQVKWIYRVGAEPAPGTMTGRSSAPGNGQPHWCRTRISACQRDTRAKTAQADPRPRIQDDLVECLAPEFRKGRSEKISADSDIRDLRPAAQAGASV